MRLALLLPLLAASCAQAQQAPQQAAVPLSATISVDARRVIGPVNRRVFGHNIEAANGKGIFGPNDSLASMRAGDGFWNPDAAAPVAQAVAFTRDVGASVLRYPGGCLVHGFDWKKTIGPLAQRPQWDFGVDEYLKLCASTGAEPLMNVADYTGTPQDAADLVEYLNAPAVEKHPWAMKRAANGRRQPWNVRYFEMGNETDHGNHDLLPKQKWTAAQYASWFNECAAKMRAVDPKIQLGALMGTGTGPADPWNDEVLAGTKGRADFIIVHTYPVGVWVPDAPVGNIPPVERVMRASMAAVAQTSRMLGVYRAKIKAIAGRDLPLAITEYNVGLVQDEPQPMRFAFGPALFSADYQRELLRPQSNVLMANYWHLLNGYWGAIQGPRLPQNKQEWKRYPAYFLFRLWAQHFGDQLVASQSASPRVEFEGMPKVKPASGTAYQAEKVGAKNLIEGQAPSAADVKDAALSLQVLEGGVWRVEAKDLTGEKYLNLLQARPAKPGQPGQSLILRFEARSGGDWKGARLGLSLIDARGWAATKSGAAAEGAQDARDWKPFEARLEALSDSPGASVTWRILAGEQPASGFFEVRNVQVLELARERFPAYEAITTAASRSRDGKKMFIMVFNKHHEKPIATTIRLDGFAARRARRWVVSGPDLAADNRKEEAVREVESGVATPVHNGAVKWTFPARSMTAIEIDSK